MKRGILVVVIFVLLGIIAWVWWFRTATITGREFSPQTFTVRNFEYKRNIFTGFEYDLVQDPPLPLVNPPIQTHLAKFNPATDKQRWHLIEGITDQKHLSGDADILVSMLQITNAATAWSPETWSQSHPTIAAQLWPLVQSLADCEMYFVLPELVQVAMSADDAQKFTTQAKPLVASALRDQLTTLCNSHASDKISWQLKRIAAFARPYLADQTSAISPELQNELSQLIQQANELSKDAPPEPDAPRDTVRTNALPSSVDGSVTPATPSIDAEVDVDDMSEPVAAEQTIEIEPAR